MNDDPANGIFGGMVGGMPMEEFMHWYIAADGTKLLEEFRAQGDAASPGALGMGSTEFLLHSHKPVKSIADFKGMRSAPPTVGGILKSLGASATVLPGGEIYTALERRVIDANEFVTPATNIKMGFHKVAKYIIMPGLHSPSHMNEATFKLETWNKLPKADPGPDQRRGPALGFPRQRWAMGVQDLDAVEKLMAGKNTWITLDAAAQAKIEELGRSWSAEQAKAQAAKGNNWMTRVSDSYWGFYSRYKKFGGSTGITRPVQGRERAGWVFASRVLPAASSR